MADHEPDKVQGMTANGTMDVEGNFIRRISPIREEARQDVRPSLDHDSSSYERGEAEQHPSPPGDPTPSAGIRPSSKHSHPFSQHVIALIAPFAMLGLLARLGLEALTGNYDGKSVFNLAWVQGMGCFVMGLAAGLREPISQFYAPLYFAIATGFCGSLTTFSSWNLDVFLAWENASGYQRVWLYDIIDGLTQILATLAISMSALFLGLHISELILPHIPLKLPVIENYQIRYALSALSITAYILTIPLYFILPAQFRSQATAALLFSFPGALLRHAISIKLNPVRKSFPLGTFAVNILGTLLIGILYTLQRTHPSPSALGCVMLQALMDGFCGCLTTVSTLTVEIRALKVKAWAYFGASLAMAQILLAIVVGIPWWSGAVRETEMCAFER